MEASAELGEIAREKIAAPYFIYSWILKKMRTCRRGTFYILDVGSVGTPNGLFLLYKKKKKTNNKPGQKENCSQKSWREWKNNVNVVQYLHVLDYRKSKYRYDFLSNNIWDLDVSCDDHLKRLNYEKHIADAEISYRMEAFLYC